MPFTDFQLPVRNIRTTDAVGLTADVRVFGGWHVLGGASGYRQKDDLTVQAVGSYQMKTWEGGLQYLAESGSSITASQRSSRGVYLQREIDAFNIIDNGFRQYEPTATVSWKITAASTLAGRVTRLQRIHDHFSQRDFSGITGEFDYTWARPDSLRFDLSYVRDIRPWQEAYSSYRIDSSLSFAATWQVTAKVAAHMRLSHMDSDFQGPILPPPGPLRKDSVGSWEVGADWTPWRVFTVGASFVRQYRDTNEPTFQFVDSLASLRATLTF